MENDEKEDLLLDVSDCSDNDISDIIIQEKILQLLDEKKQTHKSSPESVILIFSCLLLFISSTTLLICVPVYIHHSSRLGLQTYGQLFTLASSNVVLFTILYTVIKWMKRFLYISPKANTHLHLCLPSILKSSCLLSVGGFTIFTLLAERLISCHLQDPLKGCVVVFSLMFYFLFSRRKSSVERVFCTITAIVGTFVTVDFGLCNRFRCRGTSLSTTSEESHTWHGFYVIAYLLAMAAFALHFTILENCCRSVNYGSNLDLSIVSGEPSSCAPMPSARSLSIISGLNPEPLNVSLHRPKFPQTSTPNEGEHARLWGPFDWLAAHHFLSWLLLVLCCWIPTVTPNSQNQRLLVDVVSDVYAAFSCHVSCADLFLPSAALISSYVLFATSAVFVLVTSRSALIVNVVLMNALPMAALFWSVYQFDGSSAEAVKFHWAVTGETISAMLGFPIIGVGTFLLLKSQVSVKAQQASLRFRVP